MHKLIIFEIFIQGKYFLIILVRNSSIPAHFTHIYICVCMVIYVDYIFSLKDKDLGDILDNIL